MDKILDLPKQSISVDDEKCTSGAKKKVKVVPVVSSDRESEDDEASKEKSDSKCERSVSVPSAFSNTNRRRSYFQQMLQASFSEGSRLNEEKALELEQRLKSLASAFSSRTKKTITEIKRPPTPSSDEEESDISTAVSETNLFSRLEAFLPTPEASRVASPVPEHDGQQSNEALSRSRKSISKLTRKYSNKIKRIISFKYLFDPQSYAYIGWLIIISFWFLYNAWVLPLRESFQYQNSNNSHLWFIFDCIADSFYLADILFFKSHVKFLQDGFPTQTVKESWKIYIKTKGFAVDLLSLIPVDIISSISDKNRPILRLPRLLKITAFWELFARLDTRLSSPFGARITKTLLYMLYLIHLNAAAYYSLSNWEGMGTTEWTFGYGPSANGNAYIRCFYFATKTATSIGKNPRPTNEIEYLFMTFSWLGGVFVFAILIGQIRDIIATATKAQTEYRQICTASFNYLHRFDVPKHLQNRVKSWLNYTWVEQKTLDESRILARLPQKLQADLALQVHIETLSKVMLFQNCETAFLRELVVKLRSIIFLPGDYVCKKGEVGKEMYIVKAGRVNVLGGERGQNVLATLTSGSVFGEIALLAIGGMTKRTADVRTAGYANLFVLSKVDLNSAIKDYPQAQESLRRKAKKLIRDNVKKRKALEAEAKAIAAATARKRNPSICVATAEMDLEDDKVIIKNKTEEPRLIDTVLRAISAKSMTSKHLSYGSKSNSVGEDNTATINVPPKRYDFMSSRTPTVQASFSSVISTDSSEDDVQTVLGQTSTGNNFQSDDEDELLALAMDTNKKENDIKKAEPDEDCRNNETELLAAKPNLNQEVSPKLKGVLHEKIESILSSSSEESIVNCRLRLQRQYSIQLDSNDEEQ